MENRGFESFDIPFDSTFEFDTAINLDFFNLGGPTIADVFSNYNNVPIATAIPQQQNNINDSNNLFGLQLGVNVPFAHPTLQPHEQLVQNNSFPIGKGETRSFEMGGSSMGGQNQNQNLNFFGSQNYNESMPLSEWPPKSFPFLCSCCHVLREIIHCNGTYFEKLEIHGILGVITHAIHHHNIPVDGSSNTVQVEMIDLCGRNIEEIKTTIQGYCRQQTSAGYFMVQDPLSSYYEALCTGMEWIEDVSDDDLNVDETEQEVENNAASAENNNGSGASVENKNGTAPRKPTLSQQRERAAGMKLSDFSDYFHLPMSKASEKLSLCPTVVKKICRKKGLPRWPYRKVKSIARQMEMMRRALVVTRDPFIRRRTQADIDRLERHMIKSCAGVAPTAIDYEALMKEVVTK